MSILRCSGFIHLLIFATMSLVSANLAFSAEPEAEPEVYGLAQVLVGDEFSGRFKEPSAVFYDEAKDRLYIADTGNRRFLSFDNKLEFLAEYANGYISMPYGIVKTAQGLFFSVDVADGILKRINPREDLVEPVSVQGLPDAIEAFTPGALAISGDGLLLYVVDRLNRRIVVLDNDGTFVRQMGIDDEGFYGFSDLSVDDDGTVYAVDSIGARVYVFDGQGVLKAGFGARGDGEENLRFPVSVATDSKGLVYVLDRHGGVVKVFSSRGIYEYTISRPGPYPGSLEYPVHMFIDRKDTIYIVDGTRVQVFKETAE